jgi:hypothetical protein
VQNWLIKSLLVLLYIDDCGLLRARFGEIDQELAGLIPRLMSLESDEYTRLLLNLSRSRSVG